MPAFTSIFRALCLTLALGLVAQAPTARAQDAGTKNDRTTRPEEEDFQGTPYTQYGEFSDDQEEEEETRFLQRGRLFGFSAGVGMQFVTGNRGSLFRGGFPLVDLRLHYWFDFQLAMTLQYMMVNHYYDIGPNHYDVAMNRIGADIKYYFDIANLSAAITFSNPYILVGLGAYSKNTSNFGVSDTPLNADTQLGMNAGLGFEFPLKPRKMFINIEGKLHVMSFRDTYAPSLTDVTDINDLTGLFWSVSANLLLTW